MRNHKLHNAIQLVRLNDEDIRWYCTLNYWTLVEAPFILTGHRPPTVESIHHFLDHSDLFPYEFREALNRAVEAGVLCQQRFDRSEQRRSGDTPAKWLAWVDSLEPKDFSVDERVRRLLPSGEDKAQKGKPSEETRREKGKRETKEKHQRWYDLSQLIKKEEGLIDPIQILCKVVDREKKRLKEIGLTERGLNAGNIRRRLDEHHPGWAD